MGFFQDLKQDLSQAVNEVSTEELELEQAGEDNMFGQTGEELKDLEAMLEEEVSALGTQVEAMADTEETATEETVAEETATDAQVEELLNEVELNMSETEEVVAETKEETIAPMYNSATELSTDTAVITAGMTITGDISSSGNMDLVGSINGNIDILGKLNITGSVNGNSSAAEIYAESAQINGEVKSKGSVKIGQSSVVIGNIYATSAVIAGAVKGDIDVHGPVILDTSAIVMGNIKSKSVQINNGAVIEGMCSQCYAEVSPTSFFNDVKKNRKAV